uniref:Phosphoglucomutase 2 n=1 Tax=Cebus imitator TaxID=2715852 RepID=A0A2K5SA21_CEBIM
GQVPGDCGPDPDCWDYRLEPPRPARDKNSLTSEAVKLPIAKGKKEELRKCFGARMEFGTAGLQAPVGPGISRMNDLITIQTTQGFCRYLEKQFSDLKQKGIVISFDAQAHLFSGGSSRFARLAATTFISQGIPVYLFSDITPTRFVPFTVLHLKLCAGILITASHNQKQDNGYKVYWDNGAQIISPHDKEISQAIEENLEQWPQAWNDSLNDSSPLLHNPSASINKYCFYGARNVKRETKVKFVHTSVHGQSAFKASDLVPPEAVPEQKDPDPEFPTVKYQNPKEGKLIVLANHQDADRLAVAKKQDSGEWRVFWGNKLGALLGWWIFTPWNEKNRDCSGFKDPYMLSSNIFSKILRAIALKEGFHFEETLTGFKWMGNRAKQLIGQGKTILFAFEEAIGYMCCPFILDKDGLSAALASFPATKNLSQQLKAIYVEYSHHITKKLFECRARCKFEISAIRDLTTSYNDNVLPTSKSSQMITFTFANGGVATMGTSGTEPKIKYYELCAPPGNSDPKQLKKELNELVSAIEEHFFQPQKYNLQPKGDQNTLALGILAFTYS